MKTTYKWFDYFLNALLIAVFIPPAILIGSGFGFYRLSLSIWVFMGASITILCFLSLLFSLLYIILGTVFWINSKKKNIVKVSLAKQMLLKGIIRGIISVVLFFIFSLALSFFGLALSGTHMPQFPDEEITKDFPVKDLQITNLKNIPPQASDNSWSCDVTVHNTNPHLDAINLSFANATEKDNDDTISAGQTRVFSLYPDDSTAPCKDISIEDAQVVTSTPKQQM